MNFILYLLKQSNIGPKIYYLTLWWFRRQFLLQNSISWLPEKLWSCWIVLAAKINTDIVISKVILLYSCDILNQYFNYYFKVKVDGILYYLIEMELTKDMDKLNTTPVSLRTNKLPFFLQNIINQNAEYLKAFKMVKLSY